MPAIIKFYNVSYSYPGKKTPALENINLSVEQGEFLAVMGESGCGKTTLCRLMNGILPHSEGGKLFGTVTVDGEDTGKTTVAQLALKVGMALDDPDAQLFTSSVRHEAAFGPENLLLPPDEIEKRVEYSLNAAGLGGLKDRIPATLSGGEKQRLAIAAALSMAEKILVLDDPLSRLDPQGADDVMSVLRDIRQKLQLTIVMTTHNSHIAGLYADRICILNKGRIAACGKTDVILADNALLEANGIEPYNNINISRELTRINTDYKIAHGLAQISTDYNKNKFEIRVNPCESVGNNYFECQNGQDIPAVKISNYCYSYSPDVRIENINLSIAENDFIAITGNNGCGKTTLLKSIAGLMRPSCGDIFIRGKNIKDLAVQEIALDAGFVMQNSGNQLFTGSVFDEVSFALKNLKYSKTEINKRVQKALSLVFLEDTLSFPHALNRCDRVKTVLACVLAMGCKILLLDEVDTGLDYRSSRQIMDILKNLNNSGYTIVFISHNIPLSCEYAKRFIMMDRKGISCYEP